MKNALSPELKSIITLCGMEEIPRKEAQIFAAEIGVPEAQQIIAHLQRFKPEEMENDAGDGIDERWRFGEAAKILLIHSPHPISEYLLGQKPHVFPYTRELIIQIMDIRQQNTPNP